MSRRRVLLAAAVAVGIGASAPAHADAPDPKRSVALLEFRGGSPELAQIDQRAAAILDRLTSLTIVSADEARRRYEGSLDRDVAACAGDDACIARIGRTLRVDEVLLIGVSEFGDVILTMQRIDVRRANVAARIAEALAPGADPNDAELTRYLERLMPSSDFMRWGVIRIDANIEGAVVRVGDKLHGKTPVKPLRVQAPASYDIRLTKAGYTDFRATVDVPPDAIVKVRPTLALREDPAWYKRWWVAAIAGTVVVGAVTVGVLATRPDPTDVPTDLLPF